MSVILSVIMFGHKNTGYRVVRLDFKNLSIYIANGWILPLGTYF
jgi:hypothetical protein